MSMSAISSYGQMGSFWNPYGLQQLLSLSQSGLKTTKLNWKGPETLLVFKRRFSIGEKSGTTTWIQLNTVLSAVNRIGTLDNVNHNNLLEDSQFALSELPQVISRI